MRRPLKDLRIFFIQIFKLLIKSIHQPSNEGIGCIFKWSRRARVIVPAVKVAVRVA